MDRLPGEVNRGQIHFLMSSMKAARWMTVSPMTSALPLIAAWVITTCARGPRRRAGSPAPPSKL